MSIIQKEKKRGRIAFRVLMASALIAALSLTVFAVGNGGAWFREFFAQNSKSELTTGQVEYIDENAVEVNQSKTIGGYTVTLESFISDGSLTYFKFIVQASEEAVNPITGYQFDCYDLSAPEGVLYGWNTAWKQMEYDRETGVGVYLMMIDEDENGWHISNGDVVALELYDLESFNLTDMVLTKGTWRFEFSAPVETKIELLKEPVDGVAATTAGGQDFEVTAISVSLRTMSLQIQYKVPEEYDKYTSASYYKFGDVKVMLKDGTMVLLKYTGGRDKCWAEFTAEAPVAVEEVIYIELPGGVQIPVNEE